MSEYLDFDEDLFGWRWEDFSNGGGTWHRPEPLYSSCIGTSPVKALIAAKEHLK